MFYVVYINWDGYAEPLFSSMYPAPAEAFADDYDGDAYVVREDADVDWMAV